MKIPCHQCKEVWKLKSSCAWSIHLNHHILLRLFKFFLCSNTPGLLIHLGFHRLLWGVSPSTKITFLLTKLKLIQLMGKVHLKISANFTDDNEVRNMLWDVLESYEKKNCKVFATFANLCWHRSVSLHIKGAKCILQIFDTYVWRFLIPTSTELLNFCLFLT